MPFKDKSLVFEGCPRTRLQSMSDLDGRVAARGLDERALPGAGDTHHRNPCLRGARYEGPHLCACRRSDTDTACTAIGGLVQVAFEGFASFGGLKLDEALVDAVQSKVTTPEVLHRLLSLALHR